MEFVIYALLIASGFVAGFFVGRSKKTDPAPIVIEQAKPTKRAYVRKAAVDKKKNAAGVVTSADAVVNVSKTSVSAQSASLPNGRYVDTYMPSEAQRGE